MMGPGLMEPACVLIQRSRNRQPSRARRWSIRLQCPQERLECDLEMAKGLVTTENEGRHLAPLELVCGGVTEDMTEVEVSS